MVSPNFLWVLALVVYFGLWYSNDIIGYWYLELPAYRIIFECLFCHHKFGPSEPSRLPTIMPICMVFGQFAIFNFRRTVVFLLRSPLKLLFSSGLGRASMVFCFYLLPFRVVVCLVTRLGKLPKSGIRWNRPSIGLFVANVLWWSSGRS